MKEREGLGTWMVGVRVGSDARRLPVALIEFLRAHSGGDQPLLFAGAELPGDLRDLGVVSALLIVELGDEFSFWPPIGTHDEVEVGFSQLLDETIAANLDKLAEARPRETHLVVMLDRGGLSGDPAVTPAPPLPSAIDVLWVMVGYYAAKYTYRLWRTTGDHQWELLRHPLGEPPQRWPEE